MLFSDWQSDFATALLDPALPTPQDLIEPVWEFKCEEIRRLPEQCGGRAH